MSSKKDLPTLQELTARGAALRGDPTWEPSQKLLDAVTAAAAERTRVEALPDPPAPDPVVLLPEGGRVIAAGEEAAETYVAPTAPLSGPSPRRPTGPVKIRSDVDPRRQPTQPALRAGSSPAPEAEAEAEANDPPSTTAPRVTVRRAARERQERPAEPVMPSDARRRGVLVGAAIVFVAGAVTAIAATRKPEPPREPTAIAPPPRTTAAAPDIAVTATSTQSATASRGTNTLPTPAAPSTSSSVKAAPTTAADPYADAGAAPQRTSTRPTATSATSPTVASLAPSAGLVPTAASAPASEPALNATAVATSRPAASVAPMATVPPF